MGFFVLIIVGVVVAQTWHDWRRSSKDWVLPEWAKGVALGGVFAVSIAAATSFATAWMQDPSGQWAGEFSLRTIWPELGVLGVAAAVIVLMTRKKRLPWILLLAGLILAAFWLGMRLGS